MLPLLGGLSLELLYWWTGTTEHPVNNIKTTFVILSDVIVDYFIIIRVCKGVRGVDDMPRLFKHSSLLAMMPGTRI